VATGVEEEQLMNNSVDTRKLWIMENIIELVDGRCKYMNVRNETEEVLYKMLRNQLTRESKKIKENWIESCCENINENMMKGNSEMA
jgi:hypothetical protein